MVIHDETVDRVSGEKGFVKDYTLKEVKRLNVSKHMPSYDKKTRMPTLDEVFDLLKNTEMTINIELKNGIVQYKNLEKKVLEMCIRDREKIEDMRKRIELLKEIKESGQELVNIQSDIVMAETMIRCKMCIRDRLCDK